MATIEWLASLRWEMIAFWVAVAAVALILARMPRYDDDDDAP